MKIAIDLNDVVRDYSNNFVKYYLEGCNREFDLSEFEMWDKSPLKVFPFKSENSYYQFIYCDYTYELYGKCPVCTRKLETEINDWTENIIKDLDTDEKIELMFVSSLEYGPSIGSTYFFISKIGTKIREVYMPEDSLTIWDKCDVLITADPFLLENKPEGKRSIKIKTEYNNNSNADYTYKYLSDFIKNDEGIKKLLENV